MAKRVPPLTPNEIDAARPINGKHVELVDGHVPGLRVRVGPMGRHWSLAMRDTNGAMRRFPVGENLGLAAARAKALQLRQDIKGGADPVREGKRNRQRAKEALAGIGTFDSVIQDYFKNGDGRDLATGGRQLKLVKFVFAAHLRVPALDLRPLDLQLTIDAHPSASSASRAVAYAKPLCRWAGKRGLMRKGFQELEKPLEKNSRVGGQGVLDSEMLRKVLPALVGPHGQAARVMLLTGCRRSEVCGATWGEFDLATGTWTIAAKRRKDTRSRTRKNVAPTQPHIIPLPAQIIAMLQALKPVAPHPSDLILQNKSGRELDNWDRWAKQIFEATGTAGWSRHDLRRTCGTLAADLGAPPHIVSVILGHKNPEHNQLLGIYNKSRYRREHAEALQRVADHIAALEAGTSNVVSLRGISA
jgi:integrase